MLDAPTTPREPGRATARARSAMPGPGWRGGPSCARRRGLATRPGEALGRGAGQDGGRSVGRPAGDLRRGARKGLLGREKGTMPVAMNSLPPATGGTCGRPGGRTMSEIAPHVAQAAFGRGGGRLRRRRRERPTHAPLPYEMIPSRGYDGRGLSIVPSTMMKWRCDHICWGTWPPPSRQRPARVVRGPGPRDRCAPGAHPLDGRRARRSYSRFVGWLAAPGGRAGCRSRLAAGGPWRCARWHARSRPWTSCAECAFGGRVRPPGGPIRGARARRWSWRRPALVPSFVP